MVHLPITEQHTRLQLSNQKDINIKLYEHSHTRPIPVFLCIVWPFTGCLGFHGPKCWGSNQPGLEEEMSEGPEGLPGSEGLDGPS